MIFIFLSQCLSSTFLSLLIFKNKQICLFCECNNVFWLGWTVSTKTCFGLFRWRAPQEHLRCMRTVFPLVHGVVNRVDQIDYTMQYPHLPLYRGSTNTCWFWAQQFISFYAWFVLFSNKPICMFSNYSSGRLWLIQKRKVTKNFAKCFTIFFWLFFFSIRFAFGNFSFRKTKQTQF